MLVDGTVFSILQFIENTLSTRLALYNSKTQVAHKKDSAVVFRSGMNRFDLRKAPRISETLVHKSSTSTTNTTKRTENLINLRTTSATSCPRRRSVTNDLLHQHPRP